LTEDHLTVQRLSRVGMVAWPSFFALDAYMAYAVYPGTSLWPFFLYRVAGEVLIICLLFVSGSPRTSPKLVRGLNDIIAIALATSISLMALHIGGLNSAYLHGISIVIMNQAVLVPARWQRIVRVAAPCALSFPLVAGATLFLGDGAHGASRNEIASFFANYTFVLGTVVVGAAAGHAVWAAKLQVYQSRRLGRFRLEARIGEGGMNDVWLAWDLGLRRKVALKILRVMDTTSQRAVVRFEREAHAMSQLSSPNTIRVFDFGGSDDGVYYIAMEYLNGADLAKLVRSFGPLPPERVVHFALQACRSLAEAHAAGVIHRDVKPANLFVTRVADEHDVVKLLDFGIAQLVHSSTQTLHPGTIAGTPAFMSPEAWGGGRIGERSDIYSLGATLYFLLTGQVPYHQVAGKSVLSAHFASPPPAPSAVLGRPVTAALEAIVLRCLERAPEQRYSSVDDLAEALTTCLPTRWTAEQARAAFEAQLASPIIEEEHEADVPTRTGARSTVAALESSGGTRSFVR
jgi:serine/threonine-protein kinase